MVFNTEGCLEKRVEFSQFRGHPSISVHSSVCATLCTFLVSATPSKSLKAIMIKFIGRLGYIDVHEEI